MALPPQGVIDFPGVLSPVSGKYFCAHGVQPGRIVIKCAFQATPVLNVGTVRISYGSQYFDVVDCKVQEQVSFFDAVGGYVTEYLIEDRRWRWRFGEIEGHYNRKLKSGKVDPKCEKTPQEMAKLLFEAMKEQRYDFSALPNRARPEFEWAGANPAQELERLADLLGCRVVYDPLTDTVFIRKTGEGAFLPNINSVDRIGSNQTKPPVPSGIRIVGAVTRVEAALQLEPLVEDTDGQLVPPDKLSYVAALAADTGKTARTWHRGESLDFTNISDEQQRKLVKKTMWRYWRPKLDNKALASYLSGQSTTQAPTIEPENLSLELNREYTDEDGEKTKRGYVLGIYRSVDTTGPFGGYFLSPGPPIGSNKNTSGSAGDVVYEGQVQIDNSGDFPVVITGDPLWKWSTGFDPSLKILPDELYIVCSFNVRNRSVGQTCSLHRFNYFQQLTNDSRVGPEVVNDESFELRPHEDFNKTTLKGSGQIGDNVFKEQYLAKSEDIIQNRARRYNTTEAGNALYAEFVLARLDGAIQSIVWSFSESGATTEIYRNSEPDFVESKYDRRLTFNEIARKAGVTQP